MAEDINSTNTTETNDETIGGGSDEKVKVSFYNKNNPQPETQPDYFENDENSPSYIKNRIGGYKTYAFGDAVLSQNCESGKEYRMGGKDLLIQGNNYCGIFNIKIDDDDAKNYQSICELNSKGAYIYNIGDTDFTEFNFYAIIEQYIAEAGPPYIQFYFKDGKSHNCVVKLYESSIITIDEQYLPNSQLHNIDDYSIEMISRRVSQPSLNNNTGYYALINGYNCSTESRSIIVGNHLNTKYSSLCCGQYNKQEKYINNAYPSFVVANGISDTNRSNAFTVLSDGKIIVPSSTTGSTKYFAITVDDNGTITATEVNNF